jgi:hypothetical protein
MRYRQRLIGATSLGALAAGCATVVLVPGADKVRLTNTAADIAACHAVGSVSTPLTVDPSQYLGVLRNQAVGLGANAVFLTDSGGGTESGVAYRCP